jgi:predicted GNAT superfamily acetyltransferase
MPGVRDGAPTHWSHMLGVLPDARGRGVGRDLKLAQRDRALAAGVDLIEWTFDPLQSANAHLNIAALGGTSSTYLVDAYGEMVGPLHLGTPTDRLVVEWWIRRPHVERRIARAKHAAPVVRSAEVASAPLVLELAAGVPAASRVDLDARRVLIPIPAGFTGMQQTDASRALAWRHAVREAFRAYFARGYRVVDFWQQRDGGQYLLESPNF